MVSIRYLHPLSRLYVIQSRTKGDGGGCGGWGILLSTLNFASCVFEMEGLKLTAYLSRTLDHVSSQLIGGT